MEKQSAGERGSNQSRTAYDLRDRYQWLNKFSDNELRDIALCNTGSSLQDGVQYFDISHPEQGQLMARSGQTVPEESCYVARNVVSDGTWQKLLSLGRTRQAGM